MVGTKAYGSASSRWTWTGERRAPAAVGELGPLPPATDSRWSATLDLAACTYRAERAAGAPRELAELVGEGWFYVSVGCVDHTVRKSFSARTDGHLTALGAPAQPGLELQVCPGRRGPRHVDVVLRNSGTTHHRVPASLAYPRHFAFALRFADDAKDVHWSVVHDAKQGGATTPTTRRWPLRCRRACPGRARPSSAMEERTPATCCSAPAASSRVRSTCPP